LEHLSPEDVLYVQDNASFNLGEPAMAVFRQYNINLVKHPAYSPDLNPIELVWAELERRIMYKGRSTAVELFEAL
jgi:transposase